MYDRFGTKIVPWTELKAFDGGRVNPVDTIRLDALAKAKLAPFQLDIALLEMVDKMNTDELMSAYYDLGGGVKIG